MGSRGVEEGFGGCCWRVRFGGVAWWIMGFFDVFKG